MELLHSFLLPLAHPSPTSSPREIRCELLFSGGSSIGLTAESAFSNLPWGHGVPSVNLKNHLQFFITFTIT